MLLRKIKVLRIIAHDDHVIDTEKKGTTTRGSVDKKNRIMVTRHKLASMTTEEKNSN
jgi:uncharacterized protein with PIN domain